MEMKSSMIYMLIANLWMMFSWIVDGTTAQLLCLILGFLWLIGYAIFSYKELELDHLEFKLERLKSHTKYLEHEQIVLLLETIAGKEKLKSIRQKRGVKK